MGATKVCVCVLRSTQKLHPVHIRILFILWSILLWESYALKGIQNVIASPGKPDAIFIKFLQEANVYIFYGLPIWDCLSTSPGEISMDSQIIFALVF